MWFACQGHESEKDAKKELFRRSTGTRVILSSAVKIGACSGSAFDLLTVPITKGRTLLVTTEPEPNEAERYRQAHDTFTKGLEEQLTRRAIDFRWIEVRKDETHVDYSRVDPLRMFEEEMQSATGNPGGALARYMCPFSARRGEAARSATASATRQTCPRPVVARFRADLKTRRVPAQSEMPLWPTVRATPLPVRLRGLVQVGVVTLIARDCGVTSPDSMNTLADEMY
jgi:hypothetical protein